MLPIQQVAEQKLFDGERQVSLVTNCNQYHLTFCLGEKLGEKDKEGKRWHIIFALITSYFNLTSSPLHPELIIYFQLIHIKYELHLQFYLVLRI